MKITEQEFFNELDKISLLNYRIDIDRDCNYFTVGKYRYELHTRGLKDEYYKFRGSK
jgi:hypothetical protein